MSSFLSGLRSALTRAASYGSAPSSQEATADDHVSATTTTPLNTSEAIDNESPVLLLDRSQDEDNEDKEDSSRPPSSRTLSLDDSESPQPPVADPSTPVIPSHTTSTPKTIFQTAQKHVFKSAFKSAAAAKERDIFMTAMPDRTWNPLTATPLTANDTIDDSFIGLSHTPAMTTADDSFIGLSHTPSYTPSIPTKRNRSDPTTSTTPKRRRTTSSISLQPQDLALLPTTTLSPSTTSPSHLHLKPTHRSSKRQNRRNKTALFQNILFPISGVKKTVASSSKTLEAKKSRVGFKKAVSGREMMLGRARKRFWEGRGGGRRVVCC